MAHKGPHISTVSVTAPQQNVHSTDINASEQTDNIAAVSQNSDVNKPGLTEKVTHGQQYGGTKHENIITQFPKGRKTSEHDLDATLKITNEALTGGQSAILQLNEKVQELTEGKQKDTEMIEQLTLEKDELTKLLMEEREKKPTEKSTEIQTMVEAKNKEIRELRNVTIELRQETEQLRTSKQKDTEVIEQLKLKQDELTKLLKKEREKKPTDKSTEIQTMVEAKNKEIQELQIVTIELRQETEQLRTSLSKAAGAKLTEGNPDITDLSDPNRPQKLCEQFNNLYDNLWTDAFDHLSRTETEYSERIVCGNLVTIFKKCWEFCCDCADRQLEDLQDHLLHPEMQTESKDKQGLNQTLSSLEIKSVNETRKCLSRHSLQNIKQFYLKNKANQQETLNEYVNACLDICWYAAINNPKLDFNFDPKKNKDDFRAYTKSGKYVDYLVWPVMYLYVNGPLLYKGVVQLQEVEREQM